METEPTPEQIQAWYDYQIALIEWREKEARKKQENTDQPESQL